MSKVGDCPRCGCEIRHTHGAYSDWECVACGWPMDLYKKREPGDPPYPNCLHPEKCKRLGYCPRNPTCGD